MSETLKETIERISKKKIEEVEAYWVKQGKEQGEQRATDKILKTIDRLKLDDRPEIEVYLINKDFAQGWNKALEKLKQTIKEKEVKE